MLRAEMETVDAVAEVQPLGGGTDVIDRWVRWWRAGTPLDWGFAVLAIALVGAGYYQSWLIRRFPTNTPIWATVPLQVAWLALTAYLVTAGLLAWRREGRLRALVPDGYELSAAGCLVFLAGILLGGWWSIAYGNDYGVPAIFRLPNLLQIAGGALIVVGPLRASTNRGELVAGPTAVLSAALLLAVVTFFTQFNHPYIDGYAAAGGLSGGGVLLPDPKSLFDQYNHREEILGALGLMMQTVAVVGVVLWTLKQTRLPVGSITLMLALAAFLAATQLGHYSMVLVGLAVGILSDLAVLAARPRADRGLNMNLAGGLMGGFVAGVYFIALAIGPGTWFLADMTFGTILACAMIGALISYFLFPGADAIRAASVLWPALSPESSPQAPEITVERVEHALKVLGNTRDLSDNPLVGLRCLAAPTAAGLQKTIEGAIEDLRTSTFQQDAQAGQILSLYYVRRIGGHLAVMMRVGLSRAAYFNRRSYGVERLVDRLRQLEESAAPA